MSELVVPQPPAASTSQLARVRAEPESSPPVQSVPVASRPPALQVQTPSPPSTRSFEGQPPPLHAMVANRPVQPSLPPLPQSGGSPHHLVSLVDVPHFGGVPLAVLVQHLDHLQCAAPGCFRETITFCRGCSDWDNNAFFMICGAACLVNHIAQGAAVGSRGQPSLAPAASAPPTVSSLFPVVAASSASSSGSRGRRMHPQSIQVLVDAVELASSEMSRRAAVIGGGSSSAVIGRKRKMDDPQAPHLADRHPQHPQAVVVTSNDPHMPGMQDHPGEDSESATDLHVMRPFRSLPEYSYMQGDKYKRARLRCRVSTCQKKAAYFCVGCSDLPNKAYFPVCGPGTHRNCWQRHFSSAMQDDDDIYIEIAYRNQRDHKRHKSGSRDSGAEEQAVEVKGDGSYGARKVAVASSGSPSSPPADSAAGTAESATASSAAPASAASASPAVQSAGPAGDGKAAAAAACAHADTARELPRQRCTLCQRMAPSDLIHPGDHLLMQVDYDSDDQLDAELHGDPGNDSDAASHVLRPLRSLEKFRYTIGHPTKRARLRCKVSQCHSKAAFYCVGCSNLASKEYFAVCGPGARRGCWKLHLYAERTEDADEELEGAEADGDGHSSDREADDEAEDNEIPCHRGPQQQQQQQHQETEKLEDESQQEQQKVLETSQQPPEALPGELPAQSLPEQLPEQPVPEAARSPS